MKNFIKAIIVLSLIFSSQNFTQAECKPDYIQDLFDFEAESEIQSLDLWDIEYQNFKTEKYSNLQYGLKKADDYMKTGIVEKYRNKEFGYYQTSWIIKNYNDFLYHANAYLYYLKLKELYPKDKFIDYDIKDSYTAMKNSYTKVKNLTTKRNKN